MPRRDGTSALFLQLCRARGLPVPMCEHRFDRVRRWRLDYAWPNERVALEVEGGLFVRGRHSRGAGMLADMEKYNEAVRQGWRLVRCTPRTLMHMATSTLLRDLLQSSSAGAASPS